MLSLLPGPTKALLAALLVSIATAGWQTHQLAKVEKTLAQERQKAAALRRDLAEANLKLIQRTEDAGNDARDNFDEEQDSVADDLDGIDDRIDDLCLQPLTVERTYYSVSVPEAPAVAAGPAPRTGDDRAAARVGEAAGRRDPARTFAAALKRDIRYCRTELNRLSRLQEWTLAVGDPEE